MGTIAITGATGFIGSHLMGHFQKKGNKIITLQRVVPTKKIEGIVYRLYDLQKKCDDSLLSDVDLLIHCAYAPRSFDINVHAAKELFALAHKNNTNIVFISSFSAHADAISEYGKQKYAIEQILDPTKHLIIRPGLVIGNGGLAQSMITYAKNKNIVPLINGGTQPIQSIYINDLARAIDIALEKNTTGTLSLAEEKPVTYKEFYTLIYASLKRKPIFVSVPYFVMNSVLSITSLLLIHLAITKENLLGLKMLRFVNTKPSVQQLGITLKTTSESLKALLNNE